MKYVILLCDGMADTRSAADNFKTPMEQAKKPNMDFLAKTSYIGTVKTVPDNLSPGSDVANLSVLGYDPDECYTGRSPLEAMNIGVKMGDGDMALRCNLVTLSDDEPFERKKMTDYCAGDISTADADIVMNAVREKFQTENREFFTGTAYRHCLILRGGNREMGKFTPPHDISGKTIGEYLNQHPAAKPLTELMKQSYYYLKELPVNKEREKNGINPANCCWFWGQGSRPALESFYKRTGLKGAMISAVDLLKGIAVCAEMTVCEVNGATGYIDTNLEGKADAAINALKDGHDFVYIHIEAPDECGHRGEAENKVKAIEMIDQRVLGRILPSLREMGDFRILICPDHPTPLEIRTHSRTPVPFMIYDSTKSFDGADCFTEQSAKEKNVFIEKGCTLIDELIK
ncbi:MAG: cofactor-independent phosphoglycerate mutase [Acutalibacteraceae bacterium]